MKKYLVIRLERPVLAHSNGAIVLRETCFDVLCTFSGDEGVHEEALEYADNYNKSHGVRTLVISGEVYGQV